MIKIKDDISNNKGKERNKSFFSNPFFLQLTIGFSILMSFFDYIW